MKHVDLFSGIGGFALAARWMGWETVQFCEKEKFPIQILEKNFPGVPICTDIFNLHLCEATEKTIITGGFPCQPFLQAGQRRGMADSRALWPEMLRIIRDVKPNYVVAENVSGILNISDGLVFELVCFDLENSGYEVQTLRIPAVGIGAYHKRERVWFVAYADRERLSSQFQNRITSVYGKNETFEGCKPSRVYSEKNLVGWPTEPPVCCSADGIPPPTSAK